MAEKCSSSKPWKTATVVVAGQLFAIFAGGAGAHQAVSGWIYPLDCCNENDCSQLDDNAVFVGTNYYIWKEHRIAFDSPKIRRSPDGRFHGCENAHWGDTSGKLEVSCFFVPAQG